MSDSKANDWKLWWLQGRRLTAIEIRRNLFSWRATWIYCLALAPTLILFAHLGASGRPSRIQEDTEVLAGIVQFYYLRLAIFFGCLGIFSRLIRGEMIERSLHFYLLAPVRREVLLLSKFTAGSISAVFVFGVAILLDFPADVRRLRRCGSRVHLLWPGPVAAGRV